MKHELFGLFINEIADCIAPYGLKKFRATQIAEWIYRHGAVNFEVMTNLSKAHRAILTEHFCISGVTDKTSLTSDDGRTTKFLLAYDDGAAIETVLMRHNYGNSVCVSTQVGCGMSCVFCASTLKGVERNLTGGEILSQVLYVNKILAHDNLDLNSIVIMGSGEPLANYDNVLRFIRLCHEPYCLGLGYRNITLSTCGLVPYIDRLAQEGLPINLAVSLHAPNDTIRSALVPVNKIFPIAQVVAAADRYAEATGRRITYEYTMIAGVNDGMEHARELAALLKNRLAFVNLIPVNPVPERGLLRPEEKQVKAFEHCLKARRINVTVRREMGVDIIAACGQLRNKTAEISPDSPEQL